VRIAYGEPITRGPGSMMRSRRANGLVTIAALVALAAVGGNAARGSDDVTLAGAGSAPVVTITRTPAPTTATFISSLSVCIWSPLPEGEGVRHSHARPV